MMLLFLSRRCKKKFNKDDVGAIGESKEKYITFNVKMNVPADRGWLTMRAEKYPGIFSWDL